MALIGGAEAAADGSASACAAALAAAMPKTVRRLKIIDLLC
jgi:uncharacterized Zn-binding protein involved in type VI secretion